MQRENRPDRLMGNPGSRKYDQEFEFQALSAADRCLRMPVVRISCALLAIAFAYLIGTEMAAALTGGDSDWFFLLVFAALAGLAVVECFSVAIRGKSIWLRWHLAGVRKPR